MARRTVLLLALVILAACGDEESPSSATASVAASSSSAATSGTGGSTGAGGEASGGSGGAPAPPRVLLFSKTAAFRHDSIPVAIAALETEGSARGWTVTATEDAAQFSALGAFDVVVFLMTTGDVLDDGQQSSFETFIQAGGGYVGLHSASDTEYAWPWYGKLVGAYFMGHPAIQPATIVVESMMHPATAHLAATWMRTDEWYSFDHNPRAEVDVLMSLDETTYDPGNLAMGDHPIAWSHAYDGGRAFYSALGHTSESYAEPDFITHLAEGIEWASGR